MQKLPEGFIYKNDEIACQKDQSNMVYVPAGIFFMGSEDFSSSSPVHEVNLSDYLIDKDLVTNQRFQLFVQNDGYKNSSYWSEEGWSVCQREGWSNSRYYDIPPWNLPNHPVVGISWFEAEAYANWAGKVLPTEAQWEKAARGGIWLDGDLSKKNTNPQPKRTYPWGNHEVFHQDVWYAVCKNFPTYGSISTAPVQSASSGVSPYGCYDMSGNVWEWCRDIYKRKYYKNSPENDPTGPLSGTSRVLRGGSWCREGNELRIDFRTKDEADGAGWDLSGFRCVKPIEDVHNNE